MKISNNMIDDVVIELIGEDTIPLVDFLKTNSNVSEFQISAKIKITVDVIRNQLYRLYNHNLVSFIRKKDKQKGWYIYYWTLNKDRIKYLITDIKVKKIEKLKERLQREENSHFFACVNKCIRIDFEQATNFEYRCPECGEIVMQEDNSGQISNIKTTISELQSKIESENAERQKAIDKIVADDEKAEQKVLAAKEKEKQDKLDRAKEKKKRIAERKKDAAAKKKAIETRKKESAKKKIAAAKKKAANIKNKTKTIKKEKTSKKIKKK